MGLLEWRAGFRIGSPDVDHEHREFSTLIDVLHAHATGDWHEPPVEEKAVRARRYAGYGAPLDRCFSEYFRTHDARLQAAFGGMR